MKMNVFKNLQDMKSKLLYPCVYIIKIPSISLFIFFRPANYSADGFGHGILRSFAEFCKEHRFGAEAARSFIELRPQLNFLLFSSQPRLFLEARLLRNLICSRNPSTT